MEEASNIQRVIISNIENYRKIFIVFFIFLVIILVSLYVSEKYRVGLVLKKVQLYENYMQVTDYSDEMDRPLCDFYVASAFRPYTGVNQAFDYISNHTLVKVLRQGPRFIYLDVYSDFNDPFICHGSKRGNWKYSLNPLPFDDVMEKIGQNGFRSGFINNYHDPLIIHFNICFAYDNAIFAKMKKSIIRHLGTKLLDVSYGYAQKNIGQTKFRDLRNHAIIFCSEDYKNSEMEEIVNGTIRKVNNESVNPNVRFSRYVKEDRDTLQNYNKTNLTMVVPEENSFFTRQYSPQHAFEHGCQFVSMYYQKTDGNMDIYSHKFRKSSFILKPPNLRGEETFPVSQVLPGPILNKEDKKNPILAQCSTEVKPPVPTMDYSQQPTFKRENSDLGVCFISEKKCRSPFVPMPVKMNLVINEKDKTTETRINKSAGTDEDGNLYYRYEPNICCSKEVNVPVSDKFTLNAYCKNPARTHASIGIKASEEDATKTTFSQGIAAADNQRWVHPKLCRVDSADELADTDFCVLTTDKCPTDYNELQPRMENGVTLCCRRAKAN